MRAFVILTLLAVGFFLLLIAASIAPAPKASQNTPLAHSGHPTARHTPLAVTVKWSQDIATIMAAAHEGCKHAGGVSAVLLFPLVPGSWQAMCRNEQTIVSNGKILWK